MSKHTPGPWMATGARVDMGAGRVTAGLDWSFDVDPGEARANARLIAAAPDLLKALKDLVAVIDSVKGKDVRGYEAFDSAEAAIAKAEGKG